MAREMKDSGIEWIGEIPKDWALISFGYIADVFGRIGFRGYTVEDLVDQGDGPITLSPSNIVDQKLSLNKCSYISWDKYYESPEIQINFGDIILVKTASVGKCTIYTSKELATLNPQLVVLKNLKCNNKYLYYALISDVGQIPILLDNFGSVIPTITQNSLCHYKIPLPSISEQNIIASFLDSKCAEIDKVIDATKASIEEYRTLRQAIITEAVTKGLDPDVEMKDSLNPYIGQINAEWNEKKTKYSFRIRKDIAGYEGPTVLSITQKGIRPKSLKNGEGQQAENYSNYQHVSIGNYAMNHMDLLTGWIDISKYEGVTSPDYRVFILTDETDCIPEYYLYFFQMCYSNKIFYKLGRGVSGLGRWRLPAEQFLNFVIPKPSKKEQKDIASFLDTKCSEIDSLIKSKEKLIEELTAYRKSLIFEYVTGKKEVPAV